MPEPNPDQEPLPPEVIAVLERDGKIQGVAALRAAVPGLGLAAALRRIEQHLAKPLVALPQEILEALRNGEKLRAVRDLGKALGLGLSEAVTAIDDHLQADLDLRESYLAACGLSDVVCMEFQDGLAFPSGNVVPASYRCVVYCRVPPDWIEAGEFNADVREAVFEMLYGAAWRSGNEDGSRYVVRDMHSQHLAGAANRRWLTAWDGPDLRIWFAHAMADGGFGKVEKAKF